VSVTEDQQLGHPVGVPAQPVSPATAREAINEMLEAGLLDGVMDRVDRDGLALTRGRRVPALSGVGRRGANRPR